MSASDWASRNIYFSKSSPISGPFDTCRYPFLRKPLDSLDDITARQTVVYKASSCLGTVFSQIAMAYRLCERPGDMLFIAQTDNDAKDWMKTRGREWLKSIRPLMEILLNDKYAMTNDMVLWPHQFLIITGPGQNAQESKQVRYVHTDEAHLDAFAPGSLASFSIRMGERWDRHELHTSTASNEATTSADGQPVAKEIDMKFHQGQQDEWHQMCPHCNELFWPLWEQYSIEEYGKKMFVWDDCQSDTQTLESIRLICPLCDSEIKDDPKVRYEMNIGGDYISKNPNHNRQNLSFRWTRFAPDWMRWSGILDSYLQAMRAARSGDMSQMENFTKKKLCMTWRGHIPDLMDAYVTGDYNLGDVWIP